jgi:C-terminal processing protease CtpA/Prc
VRFRKRLFALAIAMAPGCGGSATGSVGAILVRDNDTNALYVRDVPAGLPAQKAGILPGDEIVMMNGRYVRDLRAEQIRTLLRGEVGTTVELTVVRGEEVHHMRVTRAGLRQPEPRTPRLETIAE